MSLAEFNQEHVASTTRAVHIYCIVLVRQVVAVAAAVERYMPRGLGLCPQEFRPRRHNWGHAACWWLASEHLRPFTPAITGLWCACQPSAFTSLPSLFDCTWRHGRQLLPAPSLRQTQPASIGACNDAGCRPLPPARRRSSAAPPNLSPIRRYKTLANHHGGRPRRCAARHAPPDACRQQAPRYAHHLRRPHCSTSTRS